MATKSLMLAILSVVGIHSFVNGGDGQTMIEAVVTDRDDNPIEGATVSALEWFEGAEVQRPKFKTDSSGVFRMPALNESQSGYVMIYKPGFCVGALNMRALPARARLHPMKPIALRIVDADGDPVSDAEVSLGDVSFHDEFLQAFPPPALKEMTTVKSRDDGWAILRACRPEYLLQVNVESKGYGIQTFGGPFNDKKFVVLELDRTVPANIKIESDFGSVDGWTVMGFPYNFAERNFSSDGRVDKQTGHMLPISVAERATVDNDGVASLKHMLLAEPIHLLLLDDELNKRACETIVATKKDDEFVFKPLPLLKDKHQTYFGFVRDQENQEPIEGVRLKYFSYTSLNTQEVTAVTDSSGRFELELCNGNWVLDVLTVPENYSDFLNQRINVEIGDDTESKLPDIQLFRGKTVSGRIEGVDLAIRRARWLHVSWSEHDGSEKVYYGKFLPDGSFNLRVHNVPERWNSVLLPKPAGAT